MAAPSGVVWIRAFVRFQVAVLSVHAPSTRRSSIVPQDWTFTRKTWTVAARIWLPLVTLGGKFRFHLNNARWVAAEELLGPGAWTPTEVAVPLVLFAELETMYVSSVNVPSCA